MNEDDPSTEREAWADGQDGEALESLLCTRIADSAAPIRLEGVTKRYGGLVATRDVTCQFESGEFHCVAGPNGSGKTTLGKVLVGLIEPTSGEVHGPRGTVGYGFQRPRFYSDLSVEENVDVFARLAGTTLQSEWVQTILSVLRLSRVRGQVASELSGGFKKKLDLAIALLDAPAFLWLDEPFSDVDDISVERILTLLSAYVNAGGCVVVSTHNLAVFEDVATHLTVFLDGVSSETVERVPGARSETLTECYETVLTELQSTAGPQ